MAYAQLTRAQLRVRLQDYYEAAPFWDDTEANAAINESLRTWNLLTGRWRGTEVMNTTVGNPDYGLNTPILYRTRVLFNGRPLSPTSLAALSSGRPNWWIETTASGGEVPTRPTLWCPISLRLIMIWPADAVGDNSLTINGVAATPVLVTDGEFVNLSEADVSVLLRFALHLLLFKKGGSWFASGLVHYRAFLKAAAEENQILTTSARYRKWMGLYGRDEKPLRDPSVPDGLGVPQPGGGQ